MTTTELDTQIAGLEATLRALEQGHARHVGALHKELAAVTARRWLVHPNTPLAWSPWIPSPQEQAKGRQAVSHLPAPSGLCSQVR
jgi:hypothetical protein